MVFERRIECGMENTTNRNKTCISFLSLRAYDSLLGVSDHENMVSAILLCVYWSVFIFVFIVLVVLHESIW